MRFFKECLCPLAMLWPAIITFKSSFVENRVLFSYRKSLCPEIRSYKNDVIKELTFCRSFGHIFDYFKCLSIPTFSCGALAAILSEFETNPRHWYPVKLPGETPIYEGEWAVAKLVLYCKNFCLSELSRVCFSFCFHQKTAYETSRYCKVILPWVENTIMKVSKLKQQLFVHVITKMITTFVFLRFHFTQRKHYTGCLTGFQHA